MKQTLLFAGVLVGCAATAQITITQSDLAPIYAQVYQAQDTMPVVNEGAAGANQTYNLSALNQHTTDSMIFTLPQFTPYGMNFSNCNFATNMNSGMAFQYFNNQPNELAVVGQAVDPFGSGVVSLPFSNSEVLATFPATYNTAFTDVAKGYTQFYFGIDPGIGFVIDSVRIHTTVNKSSLVDGWGSVTTPFGTYNCIRQNVMRTQVDTLDVFILGQWVPEFFIQSDSARTFTFWANGLGFPLADLTVAQDLGTVTRASWMPVAVQQGVGIAEQSATPLQFYPNPANDFIYVTAAQNTTVVEITDINGRVVHSQQYNPWNNAISTSQLSNGTYLVRTIDGNNATTGIAKLIISH